MKLSADRNNLHYSPLASFATVFIDGVKVSNAVTLDTDSLEYTIADTSLYDGKDYSSTYRVFKAKESIDVKFREGTPEWLLKELLEKE